MSDLFWQTDLLDAHIEEEDDARQVLLFSLLDNASAVCDSPLQERFLQTRQASDISLEHSGQQTICLRLRCEGDEESEWTAGMRILPSHVVHPILNTLPAHHRRELAKVLRDCEDEYILQNAVRFEESSGEKLSESEREEMLLGMQTLQAEAIWALVCGELQ